MLGREQPDRPFTNAKMIPTLIPSSSSSIPECGSVIHPLGPTAPPFRGYSLLTIKDICVSVFLYRPVEKGLHPTHEQG